MTEDQGKENTPSDRLEEIKREEKEDASSYYAQGDTKDNVNEEAELSKPVEDVNARKEEMNMLKAVAFLGFGMAALAIIFILFFVRDLDTRVVDVDGAVTTLEEKMAPLRQHVDDSIAKVNQDIAGLDNKIGSYERVMAVMELKRALATVQGMSMGNSANIKSKSNQVVAEIESLLVELGAKNQHLQCRQKQPRTDQKLPKLKKLLPKKVAMKERKMKRKRTRTSKLLFATAPSC